MFCRILNRFGLGFSEDLEIFDWADNENELAETMSRILQVGIMLSAFIDISQEESSDVDRTG